MAPGAHGTILPARHEREQARLRGHVALSPEVMGVAALVSGGIALWLTWADSLQRLIALFSRMMALAATPEAVGPGGALTQGAMTLAAVAGPILFAALAGALLAGLVQTGGLFSLAQGEGGGASTYPEVFDLVRLARALILTAGGAGLAWTVWRSHAPQLLQIWIASPGGSLQGVERALASLALGFAPLLLLLGVGDLIYRRLALTRALAMTPAEARRRRRETEGDPLIQAERRGQHRRLSLMGGPQAVREKACLLVISESVAVALAYREGEMAAPQVLAQGRAETAWPLIQAAREAGIPVANHPALATDLSTVEQGKPIPSRLFAEVARLLGPVQK